MDGVRGVGAASAPETVFMFSGQGSQYFHMGRELFEGNQVFREWMERLDEIVRGTIGTSVIATIYSDAHGKGDLFDRTAMTHPAIFMVEYALARCLIDSGLRPDMVLGVSLGAFAAAAVAGFVEVEHAVAAVMRQARALEERGEPGSMVAVLADPALFQEASFRRSALAAVNGPAHFVVAARNADLVEVEGGLRRRQVGHQRLAVSLPFHSPWIDGAQASFDSFMRSVRIRPGRLPLLDASSAEVLHELPDGYFWTVVRRPIRFREATVRLARLAARRLVDVGPAGTLAAFLKHTIPDARSTVHAVLTPFGRDRRGLAAVLAAAGC